MKKVVILIVLTLSVVAVYWLTSGPGTVSKEKAGQIQNFLRAAVVDTLEEDYRRHGMNITAAVTHITIDRLTKEETREFIFYTAYGRVSYRIKGKRKWLDKEGNLVQLDPEGEITHWFSCGILEDRYGDLLKDTRRRLSFYADNPIR